jgi:hypothetical protein
MTVLFCEEVRSLPDIEEVIKNLVGSQ